MARYLTAGMLLLTVWAALPCPARACLLCGDMANRRTLREEMKLAQLVIYGSIANPRADARTGLAAGKGTTELHVLRVVKPHPDFTNRKLVVLNRFIPVLDPKDPPKYVVFFNIKKEELDGYLGRAVESADILTYLEGARAQDGKDKVVALRFFFNYLGHSDPEIAADAYLEFAKADDQAVGRVAKSLPAAQIRKILRDPKTPSERLGLYAFLLGSVGSREDGELLRSMIQTTTARTRNALDGLLCGYIQMHPEAGWNLVINILGDPKRSFTERYSTARVLAFYQNWKGAESKKEILRGAATILGDGNIADLAVNDLRRWKWWDLTDTVLALYGKPKHDSPIMQRAIIRYALSCPLPAARDFLQPLRRQQPELVREVEETLAIEKQP